MHLAGSLQVHESYRANAWFYHGMIWPRLSALLWLGQHVGGTGPLMCQHRLCGAPRRKRPLGEAGSAEQCPTVRPPDRVLTDGRLLNAMYFDGVRFVQCVQSLGASPPRARKVPFGVPDGSA